MEEKKYIKISLSTAICIVIIIFLLLGIIALGAYVYKNKDKFQATEKETNTLSTNLVVNDESDSVEPTKTELSVDNTIVAKLINKVDFHVIAVADIYKLGNFDISNIPNDSILRIGWSKMDPSEKKSTSTSNKVTASQKALSESIENIFGKINYTDESFNYITVPTFYVYSENNEKITYNNGTYNTIYGEVGGGDIPFIYQQFEKALKYDDKIELYVKTAFIDTEFKEDNGSYFNYTVYSDFDFDKNEFKIKVLELTDAEYVDGNLEKDQLTTNAIITKPNSSLTSAVKDLNTYVYTFELDESTNEYYFSAFNEATL